MLSQRVNIKPEMIKWARKRARFTQEELAQKSTFKKLPEWEEGKLKPTLKQLEQFSRKVHLPIGYLFGSKPPEEKLPITDFRTLPDNKYERPSLELLDTIHACLLRRDWYKEFALREQLKPFDFIGSTKTSIPPEEIANQIARTINYSVPLRTECKSKEESFRFFRSKVEKVGIMVMVSGIVRNNTNRKLSPKEFRGFALADHYAPLIFINGMDSTAAKIFTLAHELAHLWLGNNGVSNVELRNDQAYNEVEIWCNKVAAELLVPKKELEDKIRIGEPYQKSISRLSLDFKVSTLVILRRLLDTGFLERIDFESFWDSEINKIQNRETSGGGDFYANTLSRVGRTFASALISSTLENNTLYRDAFGLLDISCTQQFNKLAGKID